MKTFGLAPMTTELRVMTVIILLSPALLALGGVAAPGPVRLLLLGVTGFLAVIYLSVWLWWRPSRFELTTESLTIVWPLRSRVIPWSAIREASLLRRAEFRQEYGYGMRIGSGGLWGSFGLLVTRRGTLAMYISRTDAFVLIQREADRPLMITPEQPERFVEELMARGRQ